ncbi:Hypp6184 [Branchiostoma lanceolatum]|uniref:Hypp6184 protein n=1 Tax=Branchiostoma lanceolatum TaxID=7740 RepID=A0A8J9W0V9_BRALA|nr:Hypp6184 [Branchiostoma lanceolatum]
MTPSGDPLVFTGRLYPVRNVIANTTEPTKSPVFRTGSHELRLVMLPPTRHPDNHLGIYINLVSGGAVVINTRILVTYGPVTNILSAKVTLKSGETKGWQEAMSTEAMVGQPASTTLNIETILQPFLD